jgi:hypothetical protein
MNKATMVLLLLMGGGWLMAQAKSDRSANDKQGQVTVQGWTEMNKRISEGLVSAVLPLSAVGATAMMCGLRPDLLQVVGLAPVIQHELHISSGGR